MKPKFIVAEVSKSWTRETPCTDILCQRFEKVINVNYDRGYQLKEWKIVSTANVDIITETIIAIFELIS